MKFYEVRKNTIEVKHPTDYYPLITLNQETQEPEIIMPYNNLKSAEKCLNLYNTTIDKMNNFYLITEYYIEENKYNNEGEWVTGGDIYAVSDITADTKEYYNIK